LSGATGRGRKGRAKRGGAGKVQRNTAGRDIRQAGSRRKITQKRPLLRKNQRTHIEAPSQDKSARRGKGKTKTNDRTIGYLVELLTGRRTPNGARGTRDERKGGGGFHKVGPER